MQSAFKKAKQAKPKQAKNKHYILCNQLVLAPFNSININKMTCSNIGLMFVIFKAKRCEYHKCKIK